MMGDGGVSSSSVKLQGHRATHSVLAVLAASTTLESARKYNGAYSGTLIVASNHLILMLKLS